MKKVIFVLLIIIISNISIFSQSQERTMYVAVKSADVKSSSGAFAEKRGVVNLGDVVTMIRASGNWAEIRTRTSLSGWVALSSLSSKRVTGTGLSSSAGEIALAGKGFSPETEVEYKKNGLDYAWVDRMETLIIPENELRKFVEDGRLARGQ